MSAPQDGPGYDTRDTRLVVHLYRQYELPVTYAAAPTVMTGAMQSRLMLQIQEFQADYLARIGQLRHNYTNCVRLISGSGEPANHRGIYQRPVGWYQVNQPEVYERFKQLLLDIRDLLPALPVSPLDGVDEAVAERLRRFETEANAVIVQPVRDMALKVLTHALVGEGLLTEQAMLVYFDLRDDDFTRPGFSKVIARVIHDRQRLYFRKHVPDSLLVGNINVLQGQLDGHCSHLMSLLTSRDMSEHVRSTLRSIRRRHLPVIMSRVVQDLASLDEHRAAIYAHALADRPVSLKDLALQAVTADHGSLFAALAALREVTRLPAPEDDAAADSTEPAAVLLLDALAALCRFGDGLDRLPRTGPDGDVGLDLKIEVLRLELGAAVDAGLAFLAAYTRVLDKVEAAVRPLLGLISFDSGGQSEFYARWFPGLHDLLERDRRLDDYRTALQRLGADLADTGEREAALRQALAARLTPAVHDLVQAGSPVARRLPAAEVVDVLAAAAALLEVLAAAPAWFHELEAGIYQVVAHKRTQAQQVIAASQQGSRPPARGGS